MHSQRPPRSPCTPGDQGGRHALGATKDSCMGRSCHALGARFMHGALEATKERFMHGTLGAMESRQGREQASMQQGMDGRAWACSFGEMGVHGHGGRWLVGRRACMATYQVAGRAWRPGSESSSKWAKDCIPCVACNTTRWSIYYGYLSVVYTTTFSGGDWGNDPDDRIGDQSQGYCVYALDEAPLVWCDNTNTIVMAANPVLYAKTEHDLHFIRENVMDFSSKMSCFKKEKEACFCKSTPYPGSCFDSLKLSISVNISPNPNMLFYILQTLNTALSEAVKLTSLFSNGGNGNVIVEKQRGALQDCMELHESTLSLLKKKQCRESKMNTSKPSLCCSKLNRNKTMIEETKRSIHDALCVARNLILNNSIVYGGGSAEVSCSIAVEAAADKHLGVEQYAIRAFADALDFVPMTLAENSGLQPIEDAIVVKSQQIKENNPHFGIHCNDVGTNDMREQNVFETDWEEAADLTSNTGS
ncbi:hypothetical protein F3Y22_tig00111100pilonHSYRG00107 [Hibiscus syriacus]|uniref:Pectinesterase inhibitor domain-containing protein n=1 Tax=Hibiscus syriacus TaxID=106335 RepID=A0A6A2Z0H0_HIBSY|nr:hypothetical protein F3Y22_tig00111100pilonHSYRG00107 [Hibiscus syriacus]